jgi:hypothetical protein
MIIWVNGAFGAGKTTVSYELHRRIPGSFVYDPENAGFFIRKNVPRPLWKEDFQDHEIWRQMNYSILHTIGSEYPGVVIVPMTIVHPQYFEEIIGRLRTNGVDVRHFTLLASRETLIKRLKSRGDKEHSWTYKQIDRCVSGLSHDRFKTHLPTDDLTPDQILNRIAGECGIELQPDRRGTVRKRIDRLVTQIRHIRF